MLPRSAGRITHVYRVFHMSSTRNRESISRFGLDYLRERPPVREPLLVHGSMVAQGDSTRH